jgi:hypothetical protein
MARRDSQYDEVEALFVDPFDRLQRILERGESQLDTRRAELAEVRQALLQLTSESEPSPGGRRLPLWEPVAADLAPPLLRHLVATTTGLVRTSRLSLAAGAGLDEGSIGQAQRLLVERRLRQRSIYPMDVMETDAGRAWVRSWAAAGEEQRLSLAPPSDFAVFGAEAVVAVAEWGNPAADYVLIRDAMLVAAFTALFDRAFGRGLSVPLDESAAEGDLRLVRLLGLGLKDESIARYLGCSLRTVRRRVARLMDVHGVQTRFQLGVAAALDDRVTPAERLDR